MKDFFKMMFASILGVFISVGIIVFILISMAVGMVASLVSSKPTSYSPASNTVLKISLNGNITDVTQENPFLVLTGTDTKTYSLDELLKAIKIAKEHSDIKGIYLEAGVLGAGTASIDAVRRELLAFKESDKFIVAYGDFYTQKAYHLCSVADKVFLNPQGAIEFHGLTSQVTFYKGLSEKLGVDWQVFKVGTYKGAVEPFMLDKLSDANREQISSYQQSIWSNITNDIAKSRSITTEDLNRIADEGAMFTDPEKIVDYKLVDQLAYKPEAEEYVKELAEQTGKKLRIADVSKMNLIEKPIKKSMQQIAVLYAQGEIKAFENNSPYSSEVEITGKIADELIKLKNNDNVKAVVLRVNSPGGSAFVSDQIWHEVEAMKDVKPIVVSMGNMAASGGYYISCAANKIIAEPNTLTGSIGIFGLFPNTTGLMKKLDITTDVVKTNKFGDILNPTRPMQADEKAILQSYIERGYDTFISRCAEGRGMSKEDIDKIGQGRVWTGSQAKELGLVDELGGLDNAIVAAAKLADIDTYNVKLVNSARDKFSELFLKQLDEIKVAAAKSILGEEYQLYQQVKNARESSGMMARLPYDINY